MDTNRRNMLIASVASVTTAIPSLATAAPKSPKLVVAKGQADHLITGKTGFSIELLVLDSTALRPVPGASIELTLVGEDSGDGGFLAFETDQQGIATVNQSLWPGRYQVTVRAPQDTSIEDTEFNTPESLLVVLEDGTYSPREFRTGVRQPKN